MFPLNFWALNANCSNTVKDMDFKFDMHVPRDTPSPNISLENFPKRRHGQGRMIPRRDTRRKIAENLGYMTP